MCLVSGRLRGAGGGGEKNAGHVSGTPQLGLQRGGAGHNLGTPGGDSLTSYSPPIVNFRRHGSNQEQYLSHALMGDACCILYLENRTLFSRMCIF